MKFEVGQRWATRDAKRVFEIVRIGAEYVEYPVLARDVTTPYPDGPDALGDLLFTENGMYVSGRDDHWLDLTAPAVIAADDWLRATGTMPEEVRGKRVDIRLRDGHEAPEQLTHPGNWAHEFGKADIVAYRLSRASEPAAAQPDAPTEQVKLSNPKDAIGDTKVPLWLCSAIAKAHWAAGQFAGLLKYGAWNWRAAGVRASVYISAMERHTERYKNGERIDQVDGTHHLGNIMACCAILLEAEYLGKLTDDRPPAAALSAVFDEVQATMARLREQYKDKAPKHWTILDEVPQ